MNKKTFFGNTLSNLKKVALMLLVVLMPLSFSGCEFIHGSDDDLTSRPTPTTPVEKAVEKAMPSVVNILATLNNGTKLGSGVILSEDGYILTNDHVIKGANSLEVHLADKRTLQAKLVGRDSRMDLAVIKADGNNLQAAVFSDSSKVLQANEVIAIGNAQGVENSVTRGIISNIGITVNDGQNIREYLQTDTAINPGNSGGALVNMQGEVIGIPTAGRNDSDNISYAIPSNTAKRIAEQIIDKGYISYPYLGINAVNKKTSDGVSYIKVVNIMDNSPASRAGFKNDDVIYQVNDVRVETVSAMREQFNNSGVDNTVSVYVYRNTDQGVKEGIIEAKLEELPRGYYTIDWS